MKKFFDPEIEIITLVTEQVANSDLLDGETGLSGNEDGWE